MAHSVVVPDIIITSLTDTLWGYLTNIDGLGNFQSLTPVAYDIFEIQDALPLDFDGNYGTRLLDVLWNGW
jgi:hypothetical protein